MMNEMNHSMNHLECLEQFKGIDSLKGSLHRLNSKRSSNAMNKIKNIGKKTGIIKKINKKIAYYPLMDDYKPVRKVQANTSYLQM